MSHDVVIRNGRIVDGLNDPAVSGDVAIDGDKITALGEIKGRGAR